MFKWIRLLFSGKGKNKIAPATNNTVIEIPAPPKPANVDTGVRINSIKPSGKNEVAFKFEYAHKPRRTASKKKKKTSNAKRKTKQNKRA